ncbi:hypothetical protein TH63_04960 [Rufibacter radiotolerans]|uniref:Uncharacterized protein n=1 Tax=Rufibacter radiotolerans TaxID=1379910 RepID=A0A0H4VHG9_9BACT|nr:hypothetical protein [Rufibacter radiotolerans]AKQ45130.1 hypothetical protein TH63_04960 [Rufibacter radiotolerans]
MKARILSFAFALIALFSFNNAFAQNLVVKQQPTATDLGKNLQICVDFAGLGNIDEVDITVYYTATVETGCINQGQAKKDGDQVPGLTQTLPGQSSTLTFDVRNGRTRGCQTLVTNFTPGECPSSNMTGTVSDVTFTNVYFTILGRRFDLPNPTPVR